MEKKKDWIVVNLSMSDDLIPTLITLDEVHTTSEVRTLESYYQILRREPLDFVSMRMRYKKAFTQGNG